MGKSRVSGTVDQSPETVAVALRQYAAGQNWWLNDRESNPGVLTFKTTKNLASYSQTVTVTMTPADGGATAVLVQTAVFQLYDWGRGRKLGQGLLDSLTAQSSEPSAESG
jgi:hypothetical protein